MGLPGLPTTTTLSTEQLKGHLDLVTEARLSQVVDQLAKNEVRGKGALFTRYTGTAGSLYAAERLYTYFFALGLQVAYDSFLEGGLGTIASNVVAEQLPSDPALNSKPVLLVAHYDSLGERDLKGLTEPKIPAYGANDNGVGLAGLLEVARLLTGYRFTHPIRYIAFGAEEQGMLGSQNYTRYSIKPASSKAVINIDSFGYNPGEEDWVILGFINHGAGLKDNITAYREKYQINLRLDVKRGEPLFRSDDFYFDQTQHNSVVLTDSYYLQSPNNHTANDILANVNFRTTRKVIQLTLASVAELAGQPD
jgi:Zn-dependent M28 family amino/carboxypeptidase